MKRYKIVYIGKGLSLNTLYAQGHWTKRHSAKKFYSEAFSKLIASSKMEKMDAFFIEMAYNSPHDIDNTASMVKMFVDTMRETGMVDDDTTKYFKGMFISRDQSLGKNTFIFYVTPLEADQKIEPKWQKQKMS